MLRRWWLAAGRLSVGLGTAAGCSPQTGFQCTDDDQCSLGDVQGFCTGTSHCAYPDAECPSGFRYPNGAGTLGGMCVSGDVSSTTTRGDPTGSAADSAMVTSISEPPTTGPSTTNDSATSGPFSTVDPTFEPTMGVGVTGPQDCNDDQHPGGPGSARLDYVEKCFAEMSASLDNGPDVDYDFFRIGTPCLSGSFLLTGDATDLDAGSLTICAIATCDAVPEACLDGYWDDSLTMCCTDVSPGGDNFVQLTPSQGGAMFCNDGKDIEWILLGYGYGCLDYNLNWNL